MPKVSGLQSISEADELLRLLRRLLQAQKTKTNRKCVANLINRLQLKSTEEATWSLTEQNLREADNSEPSYRSVPRLLCVGTSFNVLQDSAKEDCFKDMERLLGPYRAPFPVKGGRSFIAGVLSCILGRHVSLTDINKWFHTPNSQKMVISEELCTLLRESGTTWPPHADGFEQCTTYKLVESSSVHVWARASAPSAAAIHPNFGVCLGSAPEGFADLCPVPLCAASEADGEASSSSDNDNLQLTTMPFPEGPANLLVSAVNMQHAQWLVPFDSISPPWESDVALTLPSRSNVGADLDMDGSGVSSGWLLVGSAEVFSGAASSTWC